MIKKKIIWVGAPDVNLIICIKSIFAETERALNGICRLRLLAV